MSDMMAAIDEDIRNYKKLCEQYNEPIHYKHDFYGNISEDCYGEHSERLNKRFKKDNKY
jgi:hypothetical protein